MGAFYTGAIPPAVESWRYHALEQAINGAEGMRYISSSSGNDGSSGITATFDLNRSPRHRCRGRTEPSLDGSWAVCPRKCRQTGVCR